MHDVLLSISVVTYKPDLAQFARTLESLIAAVNVLHEQRAARVALTIVDNGLDAGAIRALVERLQAPLPIDVLSTGANLGYGKAHNLVIGKARSLYHLIMNPDVLLAPESLVSAIDFLDGNPDVVALSPQAEDGEGRTQYLCKNYPAVLDLGLRAFAPAFLKRRFHQRLARYENRALTDEAKPATVKLISGCFMLCRTDALQKIGGFNARFFLYFEDFALSLELGKQGRLQYFPGSRIVHYGGDAGRKGLRHIAYFVTSAVRFYGLYGWKLI